MKNQEISSINHLKKYLNNTTQVVNLPETKGTISPKLAEAFTDKVHGSFGEFALVNVSDLKQFPGNRVPTKAKLEKYIKDNDGINLHLLGVIQVGRLNGELYIYDGGHRYAMLTHFAPGMTQVPCYIIDVQNMEELHKLFYKMNGFSSSSVNAEQRFINQIKGRESGFEKEIRILEKTSVVVYESPTNYVMESKKRSALPPQFQIKAGPLTDMAKAGDTKSAVWAINTYNAVFGQTRKDVNAPPSMMNGQIVKALQLIYQTYKEWDKDYDFGPFVKWFTGTVSFTPRPTKFQYTEQYPHERMEKRHTGTAVGLVEAFNSWAPASSRLPLYKIECEYFDHMWRRQANESGIEYADIKAAFIHKRTK